MGTTESALCATPVTPSFGAVVTGIDASQPLAEPIVQQLKDALLSYKVLFLRGQNLTAEQQRGFAYSFGAPYQEGGVHRFEDEPANDLRRSFRVSVVSHFHSDYMYAEEGPTFSVLQMLELPDVGGDTMWADLDASYHALSKPMQDFLAPLTARHVMPNFYLPDSDLIAAHERQFGEHLTLEQLSCLRELMRPRERPLVRTIPERGSRNYWLSERHTEAITELSKWESNAILQLLFRHQLRPEFVIRYRWSVGDLAVWDHRTTLHAGVNDYGSKTRRGVSVLVAGSA